MLKSVLNMRSLVMIVFAATLLLTAGCSQIQVNTQEDELPEGMLKEKAPDLSERPDGISEKFLQCIKNERFSEAYSYFGSEVRSSISQDSFESTMSHYMATASTKQAFMSRVVSSERIVGKYGTVEVTDKNSPNSKVWIWGFEKDYAGWKMRSLELPPVLRYREPFS